MKKSPNQVDAHVGSRVRMRRRKLELKQWHLADGLGVTIQQIQKYETGATRVSAGRLQQLSQLLQVPIPFFFKGLPAAAVGRGKSTSSSFIRDFLASSDGMSLCRAFMRIEESRTRRSIVHLVKRIADLNGA